MRYIVFSLFMHKLQISIMASRGPSPAVPRGPSEATAFDISSPAPPSRFHQAMVAYHLFILERRGNREIDFLTFWYKEARSGNAAAHTDASVSEEVSDSTLEILKGIEDLRDRVVEESLHKTGKQSKAIQMSSLKSILEEIRFHSIFPESIEYWTSVIDSATDVNTDSISLAELSDAVITFIKGGSNRSTSSAISNSSSIDQLYEELADLRRHVNSSLKDMQSELRTEAKKIKEEVTRSGVSTRESSAQNSPQMTPSLPIKNRRSTAVAVDSSPETNNRQFCCSTNVSECLMQ